MGIVIELYEMDPEYFKDCFFNMYYQMKKKKMIDERSYEDEDLKRRIYSSLNFFKKLVKEDGVEIGKAFNIAYRTNNIDKQLFTDVTNSCRSFKSSKKTKFKDIF
jgi:hypothetical protein